MKWRRRAAAGVLVALVGVGALWRPVFHPESRQSVGPVTVERVGALILDAGHGGEDGGAVSITGAPESQINLAIVLRMDQILGLYGTAPVVLRTQDVSLHDPGAASTRERKVSDLHNRVSMIEAEENATLVSIHQNSYPQSKYHGAQVFYAPTGGSQMLAEHVQSVICGTLQPDNNRQCKQIPESVYMMNHISCRGILVECGFLTNPEEEANLRDQGYQTKMAAVLAAACLTAPDDAAQTEHLHSGETLVQ